MSGAGKPSLNGVPLALAGQILRAGPAGTGASRATSRRGQGTTVEDPRPPGRPGREARMHHDLYQDVTDRILALLDQGVVPWRSPILSSGPAGWPRNLESDRPYRGVNVFLLALTAWERGYASPTWLTFNQARARGGSVRKGEKSTLVVFWKLYKTTDQKTGEPAEVPVLRHFRVFNTEQCDGIDAPALPTPQRAEFTPIGAAEAIVRGYTGGPAITHGGHRACYRPLRDAVHIPEPERFISAQEYYGTLFHELAHSTGHRTRLDRGIDTNLAPFGSPEYGREELVAEMAAAFLCGACGIEPATIENQAAYLRGWIKALRADKRLVILAAGAAQRAADWIRGERAPAG